MDLRHLETFEIIATEGSYIRAAEKLGYAQSTITLQMQQLEAELKTKLFVRCGKGVALTEAGRIFEEQSHQIIQRISLLQQTMRDLSIGESGQLRIGAIEPTASLRLPQILSQFCQNHPKVQLRLEVGGNRAITQRVAAGELDFGISSPPNSQPELIFEPLFVEETVLLLPSSHPLNQQSEIYASDLKEQRLLFKEAGCVYREMIGAALLEHRVNALFDVEIGSLETLKRFVEHGLGLAILPKIVTEQLAEGVVTRQVEDFKLGLPIGIVRRKETVAIQVVETVLAILRKELKTSNVTDF